MGEIQNIKMIAETQPMFKTQEVKDKVFSYAGSLCKQQKDLMQFGNYNVRILNDIRFNFLGVDNRWKEDKVNRRCCYLYL